MAMMINRLLNPTWEDITMQYPLYITNRDGDAFDRNNLLEELEEWRNNHEMVNIRPVVGVDLGGPRGDTGVITTIERPVMDGLFE